MKELRLNFQEMFIDDFHVKKVIKWRQNKMSNILRIGKTEFYDRTRVGAHGPEETF